jgi:hypothetical protein
VKAEKLAVKAENPGRRGVVSASAPRRAAPFPGSPPISYRPTAIEHGRIGARPSKAAMVPDCLPACLSVRPSYAIAQQWPTCPTPGLFRGYSPPRSAGGRPSLPEASAAARPHRLARPDERHGQYRYSTLLSEPLRRVCSTCQGAQHPVTRTLVRRRTCVLSVGYGRISQSTRT